MEGIKLGFNLANYARRNKMGIGSVKLKDGSSVKILHNLGKRDGIEIFRIKDGRLLEARGFGGKDATLDFANFYGCIENLEAVKGDAEKAFAQSLRLLG